MTTTNKTPHEPRGIRREAQADWGVAVPSPAPRSAEVDPRWPAVLVDGLDTVLARSRGNRCRVAVELESYRQAERSSPFDADDVAIERVYPLDCDGNLTGSVILAEDLSQRAIDAICVAVGQWFRGEQ